MCLVTPSASPWPYRIKLYDPYDMDEDTESLHGQGLAQGHTASGWLNQDCKSELSGLRVGCHLTIPTENPNLKFLSPLPPLEERSLEVNLAMSHCFSSKVEALQKRTVVITTLTQVWVAYGLQEFTQEVQLVDTN